MIKVIQFRERCIGCNSCVEHAPNTWKIDEADGKSILIGGVLKKEAYILEIDESQLEENEKAAQDCPVSIIQISKSGQK